MKKEELIKKIGEVVMKNAKKGKLTPTKFVGTYNYKSGYDTFFAVSVDAKNVLVVYSYYQNDRGEHIDTIKYKLSELTEEQLEKVFKTLNTKDKTIHEYIAFTGIEDENTEILIANGIYKPTKKVNKFIDIDNIPELEDKEHDAYWIDREDNVGILKFRGKTPSGDDIYEVLGKNIIGRPYDMKKVCLFHCTDRYRKNKGAFLVVDGEDTSDEAFIYVPTKRKLLDIAKKERELKEYYVVESNLFTKKTIDYKKPYEDDDYVSVFTDKQEAVDYFNSLKEQTKLKFTNILSRLEKRRKEVKISVCDDVDFDPSKLVIESKDGVIGEKYYQCSLWGNVKSKEPFTIVSIDKGSKLIHLDNGCVLPPNYHLLKEEDALKVLKLEEQGLASDVRRYLDSIDTSIERAKYVLNSLEDWIPFSSKNSIPSWFYDDAKECLEKEQPAMAK